MLTGWQGSPFICGCGWRLLLPGLRARFPALLSSRSQQDAGIRRALIESLYASPLSLAIGAITGFMLNFLVAYLTGDTLLTLLAIAICSIAVIRTVSATFFHRQLVNGRAEASRTWELIYEYGAWGYAAMLGVMALATLLRSDSPAVHMIPVAMAVGYAGGISGRNAGQVDIAIGQTMLALAPTALGLMISGSIGYQLLGFAIVLMGVGLAEISRTTHRIVVEALKGKQEKSQLAAKFERLARYDSLTGVENRMAMQMRLRELFDSNMRSHDAVAVLWLDLDRFKEVNDSLGHMVGDGLLRTVVERLHAVVDGRGHVARFGGDEFVVICPETDRVTAQNIASDIAECFQAPIEVGSHNLSVTTSIGVAVAPQDGRDMDELMQHADLALYEAKQRGRNQAVTFTWSMKERFHRIHEIETGLRRAIENDELVLHYQPIFELKTGRIAICEALLRWNHPTLGMVSPAEFIPIAESTGVIEPMTAWVIEQACQAAAEWPDDVRVAVNISPASMKSGDLPGNVIAALLANGLSARRLELEVTESIFLEDDGHTNQILRDLRRIGLRLILDDFGTGYSSLSYLRSYHFDGIKIDRSFMQSISATKEDQAIVSAVGFLAGALDMETVAEGIETEEQLSYARNSGIINVQGFLLCRPQSKVVVTDMIARRVTIADAMAADARQRSVMRA